MRIFKFSLFGDDNKTIRDEAVKALTQRISEYAVWNSEQGLYLPPDFEHDPTGWASALLSMKRAFELLNDEKNGEGELFAAKEKWKKYGTQDVDTIEQLNAEIQKGLALFGKYLFYLTDTIVHRPSH